MKTYHIFKIAGDEGYYVVTRHGKKDIRWEVCADMEEAANLIRVWQIFDAHYCGSIAREKIYLD